MSTIQQMAANLADNPLTSKIAAEVAEIATRHGIFDLPEGALESISGFFVRATSDDVGEWGGREAAVAEAYNNSMYDLLRMIDIGYSHGGNEFFRTHSSGKFPDGWREYLEEAEEAISVWLAHYAWDLFCQVADDLL